MYYNPIRKLLEEIELAEKSAKKLTDGLIMKSWKEKGGT